VITQESMYITLSFLF